MSDFQVSVQGSKVILEFESFNAEANEDEIRSVFDDITPLVLELLQTELTWKNMTDEMQNKKLQAHLAMGLTTRAYLAFSVRKVENHRLVILGEASLAQNGYPEFEYGMQIDD